MHVQESSAISALNSLVWHWYSAFQQLWVLLASAASQLQQEIFVLLGLDYGIIIFFEIVCFLSAAQKFLFQELCLLKIYLCDSVYARSGTVPVCLGGLFWQH